MGPMVATESKHPFWGYPEPLKGPSKPYDAQRKRNPGLRGWVLLPAANLMEHVRPIRERVWVDAGFACLRGLRHEIETYEPLHDPTVVPLDYRLLSSVANNGSVVGHGNGHGNGNGQTMGNGMGTANGAAAHHPLSPPLTDTSASSSEPASPTRPASSNTYYSAATYRNLYLTGELSPVDVAKAILPLIRRDTEPKGPQHLYFFETRADLVLQAAEASAQRYREHRSLGPLDGVPCAVKDEYDLDGYKCCLGSPTDYTATPRNDGNGASSTTSWSVRQLQAAGAVVVGKTSMHEFGLDTTGNNTTYGTPRNPHHSAYYTGGSSSGTGGAVGLGLVPFGLGSDGGGSIRIPAAYCGVVGLKPTHSRVAFWPSENHANSCAVNGPLAADVESLAAVLEVISHPHPASPFAAPLVPRLPSAERMLAGASSGAPRPKVLGVCRAWFDDCAPAVRELCWRMVDALVADEGYTVVEVEIPFLKEGQIAHALTVLTDASTLLPKYDNVTWANRILLALGRTTSATDYLLAQKLRRCLGMHMAHLFAQHPGLLLVTPTTACAGWRILDPAAELRRGVQDADRTIASMRYVWLANFLGLPALSVPAGFAAADRKGEGLRVAAAAPRGEREEDAGGGGGGDRSGASGTWWSRWGRWGKAAERGGRAGAQGGEEGPIPVGLMVTAEWAGEEALVRFGVEAERVGARWHARPAAWVDVVALARREAALRRGDGE